MPYKDKDRQRKAVKEATRRYRKGTNGITNGGITNGGITLETGLDVIPYDVIFGQRVYGRQAVKYDLQEAWDLRPEPESPGDRPKPLNRGKYIRPDGSEYQIDAIGGIINESPSAPSETHTEVTQELPANFGQPDCQCMHCRQNRRSKHPRLINHGKYRPVELLKHNEVNRVALPGDVDYKVDYKGVGIRKKAPPQKA